MKKQKQFVEDNSATFSLGEVAKFLDLGLGRTGLMIKFREWGWLLKKNEPSQEMINRGYMKYVLKEITIQKMPSLIEQVPVSVVTIERLAYFKRIVPLKLKYSRTDQTLSFGEWVKKVDDVSEYQIDQNQDGNENSQ